MVKHLIQRSGVLFSGLLFSKVFTTFVYILIARALVPSEFGALTFFITVVTIITVIGDFGLVQWYQKFINNFEEEVHLHHLVSARTLTLLVSIFLVSFLLLFFHPFQNTVSFLLVLFIIPEAFLSIFDGSYFHQKKVIPIAIKASSKVFVLFLGYFLFHRILNLELIVLLLLLSDLMTCAWFIPWKKLQRYSFSFHKGIKTLQQSKPYALLNGVSLLYARGDALVVQYSLGSSFLGMYSAAYRYLDSLSLLPSAIAQNLFSLAAKKNGIPFRSLGIIIALVTLAGTVIAGTTFVSAHFLIVTLLGEKYIEAVPVLRILSCTLFLFFINAPLSTVVQSSHLVSKFIPFGIANTIFNIFLNILIVPIYGIQGAAVVMTLSEASGLIINTWFVAQIFFGTQSHSKKTL